MPLGVEIELGPGHIVLNGDPAPPPERVTAAPSFRRMSIVAKRSPISSAATAEHLLMHCMPDLFFITCANEVVFVVVCLFVCLFVC